MKRKEGDANVHGRTRTDLGPDADSASASGPRDLIHPDVEKSGIADTARTEPWAEVLQELLEMELTDAMMEGYSKALRRRINNMSEEEREAKYGKPHTRHGYRVLPREKATVRFRGMIRALIATPPEQPGSSLSQAITAVEGLRDEWLKDDDKCTSSSVIYGWYRVAADQILERLRTLPAEPKPAVTDEMVAIALDAYESASVHMHRGWRRMDAMRAALTAVLGAAP